MNILIDHGSAHNFGDTSMLEGVVGTLRSQLPEATLHVINRPRMESEVWQWEGVVRQPPYRLREPLTFGDNGFSREWLLKNLSRFGHFVIRSGTATSAFALELPSWMISPDRLELERPAFARTMAEYCRPFDAVHIAGGGNLTDVFEWGLIQRSSLIRTFSKQSKPVVMTGQQIGPFASLHSRRLAAHALRTVDYVGVREPTASLGFCEEEGLQQYAVTGDDCFGLPADVDKAEELLSRSDLEPRHFIALNVRLGYYVPEHEKHIPRITQLVRALTDQLAMPALVVPIAFGGEQSDIDSGYRLQEALGDRVQVLDDPDLTAGVVKGVMSLAYGAVGISYHFCTFALSQAVPAVCIHDGAYYGQKAAGLAAFWADDRISLPLQDLNAEAGAERVLSLWRDTNFREGLSARAERHTTAWREAFTKDVVSTLRSQAAQNQCTSQTPLSVS